MLLIPRIRLCLETPQALFCIFSQNISSFFPNSSKGSILCFCSPNSSKGLFVFVFFQEFSQTLPRLFLDSPQTLPRLYLLFLFSQLLPIILLDTFWTLFCLSVFPASSQTLPRLFLDSPWTFFLYFCFSNLFPDSS